MVPKLSLRRQLLRYLLVPVGVLSLVSVGLQFYLAKNFSVLAYDDNLFDTTETLAAQIRVTRGKVTVDLPPVAWDMLRYDEYDKIFPGVRWADGETIAGDAGLPGPPAVPRTAGKPIFHDGFYKGREVRVASLYVPMDDFGIHRELLVQTAETLVKRRIVIRQILSGVVLPQVILITLAAISVWIGINRGLAPLHQISQAISNRSHRDLRPIAETNVPHEVQPLLQSINGLMLRVNHVIEAQQRFIADAAHQLRTPIAGLKTQTEYAMRQTDFAAVQHILPQIGIGIARTNHLINQLLTLARSEALSNQSVVFEPLDLDRLSREVTAEWVPAAMEKDIDLGYEGHTGSVAVNGNAVLFREMLVNILDNAIRYTPEGGRVTVRWSGSPRLILSVEDNGPGIPAAERERVFERFYRVSENSSGGSGLGLAIVREIADAHGARVWATEVADGKGARINVEFST